MGRGGVTFTEVDSAARFLQGQGRNPTVDAIREKLGTGSRTTLAEHLKRWKSLQADGEGRLPQPLLSLVSGLWDSLQSMAEQRLQDSQSIAHEEVSALKSQLQIAQQADSKRTQELHHLQESLDAEQRTKSELIAQLQAAEKSHDKMSVLHQSALQQLDDTKQENQRLHKLAAQIQANLEHYQQAVQQQQLEYNLAKEKQHAIYAQELAQLKAKLDENSVHLIQREHDFSASKTQVEQLKINHELLEKNHEKLISAHQELERANIQLETQTAYQQKEIKKLGAERLAAQELSQPLHQQIAVLTSQLERALVDLSQAHDKIETLRHEKRFLAQEKSQLDGAVKQLQKSDGLKVA